MKQILIHCRISFLERTPLGLGLRAVVGMLAKGVRSVFDEKYLCIELFDLA
ncbi:MAG: hypothetical protein ACFCD0_24280 [Gemmataceae bacterium]